MKGVKITITLFLLSASISGQYNIHDSFNIVLRSQLTDSSRFDNLLSYIVEFAPNHPEEVLRYTDTAILLAYKLKDSVRLALSYNRKGVALYYLGDFNSALDNYFKSKAINENLGGLYLWRDYNNIGLVLRNIEHNEEALEFFLKAREVLPQDKALEAIILNNIGTAYRGLKLFDKAKEYLEMAFYINQDLGALQSMAHDLNNLGTISFEEMNYEISIRYFKQALDINRQLLNRYEEVQNLNNLAEVYLSIRNYELCEKYLIKAKKILDEIRADHISLKYLDLHSKFYFQTKNYRQALFFREKYSSKRDSIYAESRIKQFTQLKILAAAENEIQKMEFLKEIAAIQQEKIRNQSIVQIGAAAFILLILFTLLIVLNNLKIKKKLNITLKEQSEEVSAINEELQATVEELTVQREELEKVLENLKNAQDQLIKSEKMASLGTMAAGIAHEINNPLNFIKAGIIAIEDYLDSNLITHKEDLLPMTEGIHEGVKRAGKIVSSLGHYSRSDSAALINCNIHAIIDHCLVILQNQFKHKIEISRNYTNKQYTLLCNEGRIHQAILNILDNAEKSVISKGYIAITTNILDDVITVSIKDNGIGISEDALPKIIDPFFTTKEPGKGIGLGLYITHSIVSEHNGSLEFKSKPGVGTEAIISLPLQYQNKGL